MSDRERNDFPPDEVEKRGEATGYQTDVVPSDQGGTGESSSSGESSSGDSGGSTDSGGEEGGES